MRVRVPNAYVVGSSPKKKVGDRMSKWVDCDPSRSF